MNNRRPNSPNVAIVIRKALIALSQQKRANHENSATNDQGTGDESERERVRRQDRRMLRTNAILAFFTVVIAMGTVWQSREITNQFAIANTPYLQFEYIYDSTFQGKPSKTAYRLVNLSKVPCKIQLIQISDSFDLHLTVNNTLAGPMQSSPFANSFTQPFPAQIKINMYSTDNSPFQAIYTSKWVLDIPGADSLVKAGAASHYIYANVFYVNLVSHKTYVYQFNARIIQNPPGGLEMLTNENVPAN